MKSCNASARAHRITVASCCGCNWYIYWTEIQLSKHTPNAFFIALIALFCLFFFFSSFVVLHKNSTNQRQTIRKGMCCNVKLNPNIIRNGRLIDPEKKEEDQISWIGSYSFSHFPLIMWNFSSCTQELIINPNYFDICVYRTSIWLSHYWRQIEIRTMRSYNENKKHQNYCNTIVQSRERNYFSL